jgi:putative hydroxymethylpyrimidine transport system ATP-binding protein
MHAPAALELAGIEFGWAGRPFIDGLSMRVEPGEFIALVGPSGAGKSTIFRLVAGLLAPSGGQVLVGGAPTAPGRVGYMPQKDCLLPWRTVRQNAALALEVQGRPARAAAAEAEAHLADFGLGAVADQFPHQLSGGMRQRVAFLRTALGGQKLLLLDEPFSALDALTRSQMHEWLQERWARLGATILFITHDPEEAVFLADRVLVLKRPPIQELVEIPVDLDRPRRAESITNPEFQALRARVLQEIRS